MAGGVRVAVVGATGAVGSELLKILAERHFPVAELHAFASERSVGTTVGFDQTAVEVETLRKGSFDGIDVAFFSAGAARSLEFVPAALEAGALVIDNSSAFRMRPTTALVVPEVNGSAIRLARLIAVPNCTAILLCTVLAPLNRLTPLKRVVVSTYQSASGGGAALMERLRSETAAYLGSGPPLPPPGKEPYAFNLFSHDSPVGNDGANEEESKVIEETRKILDLLALRIGVTCVRVPVLRAHTESVTVEFDGAAPTLATIRETLGSAPGLRLVDDRAANRFPTPERASGGDDVLVGRLRIDPSAPDSLSLLLAGDQLRKGAALTAVQIAELALGIAERAPESP